MFKWLLRPATGPELHDLRTNLIANILDGGFYALTMALISQQTVLPIFVKRMGGSNVHVGLLPVLWTFGFNFPGIFVANFIQHYPRKKEIFLKTAFLQRLAWFLLGIFALLILERVSMNVGLLLFFALYTFAAVVGSVNLPIWFELIAKNTPMELRGRLFAARNILGGILGVFGGWIVAWTLDAVRYPLNFGTLFMFGVVAAMISYAALLKLRENADDKPRARVEMRTFFLSLPGILRRNADYRNFLISDALLISATMATAFYAVNAVEKFHLSDATAGTFTIVIMGTTILGNLVFGHLGDHRGHKLNLMIGAIAIAVGSVTAIVARDPALYLVAFVGAALQVALAGISRLTIVAELCSQEERLTYVALTNMVTAPFVLFGLFGGWIANSFGYDVVFVITACLAAASAAWLGLKVTDPRKRKTMITMARKEVQYGA